MALLVFGSGLERGSVLMTGLPGLGTEKHVSTSVTCTYNIYIDECLEKEF